MPIAAQVLTLKLLHTHLLETQLLQESNSMDYLGGLTGS